MVFSSLFFVFVFFLANILTQAFVPDIKKKNIVMLCFSLVFYAWSGLRFVPLLLIMTFICWVGAIEVIRAQARGKSGKPILAAAIVLVLLILGIFKYTGFFLKNVQLLTGVPKEIPRIVMPIGISFYTFQLLSYVIDVYRGDAEVQKKYWLLLLYASLFHQCIAGPIVRYRDVYEDILHRKVKLSEVSRGITRFTVGLAKKAILANGCSKVADTLLAAGVIETTSVLGVWLGAICYTLFIYLDFSAYSDMAIGMGLMTGFHYKENFNYPYTADSITDFWRRWHISLSTFFRDYVYIPLGGNRCSKARHIFNMFVVWGLTGMWHGASWNFILWGLYYFVFLVLEKYVIHPEQRIVKPLRRVLTLLVVVIGWVLFRFSDMGMLGTALKGMVGLNGNAFHTAPSWIIFQNNVWFLLFACVSVTPLGTHIANAMRNLSRKSAAWFWTYGVWDILHPLILLVLSTMALAGASYNPFLYFQF
ncbi:MAG: MBOAT family protein [Oscillospiraceae bacterium]|nr:MBOAT family protein [Oscillospiraceae bacterium]